MDTQIVRGSQSLTVREFENALIYLGYDNKQVEQMREKAMVDAIAVWIIAIKIKWAKELVHEAFGHSQKLFFEMLVHSEAMLEKAQELNTPEAQEVLALFVLNSYKQFGRYLERSDLEIGKGANWIANRSPYPSEEEQRSFLRRLFGD